jgi:hypothetical protein
MLDPKARHMDVTHMCRGSLRHRFFYFSCGDKNVRSYLGFSQYYLKLLYIAAPGIYYLEPNGYPFIPFWVETYGRLGKPAISFLGQLGLEAKEAGRKVSKSGFVAASIREISVGLCWGNYHMYRASLGLLAGVYSRGICEGAAHPTEEAL